MSKDDSRLLKGIAIMLMLWLHLFNDETYVDEHCINFLYWGSHAFAHILIKLASMCVPIYIILGSYGLAVTYQRSQGNMHNLRRAL